jgi:hypothetical protein
MMRLAVGAAVVIFTAHGIAFGGAPVFRANRGHSLIIFWQRVVRPPVPFRLCGLLVWPRMRRWKYV